MPLPVVRKYAWVLLASYKVHSFCLCVAYKRVFVVFHICVSELLVVVLLLLFLFDFILLAYTRARIWRVYIHVYNAVLFIAIYLYKRKSVCERASVAEVLLLRSWFWLQTYVHKCVSYIFVCARESVCECNMANNGARAEYAICSIWPTVHKIYQLLQMRLCLSLPLWHVCVLACLLVWVSLNRICVTV